MTRTHCQGRAGLAGQIQYFQESKFTKPGWGASPASCVASSDTHLLTLHLYTVQVWLLPASLSVKDCCAQALAGGYESALVESRAL